MKETKKTQKIQKIQKIQDIQNIQYKFIVVQQYLNHDDELPALAPRPAPGMDERPAGLYLVHRHHQVALGDVDPLGARVRCHQHLFWTHPVIQTTPKIGRQKKNFDYDILNSQNIVFHISTADNKILPNRYFSRCFSKKQIPNIYNFSI